MASGCQVCVRQEGSTQNCHGLSPSDSLGQPSQVSETRRPSSSQGLRKGLFYQDELKNRGSVWQDLWEGRGLSCLRWLRAFWIPHREL